MTEIRVLWACGGPCARSRLNDDLTLYLVHLRGYTRWRRRGRVVEGTPLLRAHTGNGIEGSNPFVSATCPREGFLSLRLRRDFSVVFEGYAGRAEHWQLR